MSSAYHKGPRTTEEACGALLRMCGDGGFMSIPADVDRDADLILADVITERDELRAKLAASEVMHRHLGLDLSAEGRRSFVDIIMADADSYGGIAR